MFVNQEFLRYLLSPADYFSPCVHDLELRSAFRPGWHILAAKEELPRPGDFKTLSVLGIPVIVRNFAGELHAFLNVCPHRHCQLSGVETGNTDALRCQYHGWEFQADGRTAKVPDARCFRPWDRDHARLRPIRTAAVGGLVYFTFDDSAPPLVEFLGPTHELAASQFDDGFELAAHWNTDYNANWKTVVENSLESYHIPLLHRQSIGVMPPEPSCEHQLDERFTRFQTLEPGNWARAAQNFMARSIGIKPANIYVHHHHHPEITYVLMDIMRMAQQVLPTSPTTSRHMVWVFTPRRRRGNPWATLVRPILATAVVKIARQIVSEDAPIFAQLQQGLEHSPFQGVIGTREERIYTFHRYLMRCYGRMIDDNETLHAKVRRPSGPNQCNTINVNS